MPRFRPVLPVLLVTMLAASAAPAEVLLRWSGQVRVRSEGFDRSFLGQEVEWDTFQRTRIGLHATVSPEVELFVQAQDARTFGAERGTLSNEANVDLHQAWAQFTRAWSGGELRVRAGRQEVAYGTERIFGAVGWSNIGRAFDALKVGFSRGAFTTDVIVARLSDATTGPDSTNDDLFVSYSQYQVTEDVRAEAYVLHRNDSIDREVTTLGQHLAGKRERWWFDQEFAYQTGSLGSTDLSAWLLSVQAHVRVTDAAKTSLGAGIDMLSGDDPTDADDQFFDVRRIFHTGHKFYGLMDVAPLAAGRAGLIDPYFVVAIRPHARVTARATVHTFMVAEEGNFLVGGTIPETETYLGTEIDVTLGWKVAEGTHVLIGGAVFDPGAVLDNQGRDETAVWSFAQGLVTF